MSKDFDQKLLDATQTHTDVSRLIVIVVIVSFFLLIGGILTTRTSKHIVEAKGANTLAFKSIDGKLLRTMQFKDVDYGMEYYKYINVGDTLDIVGISNKMVYKNVNCIRIKKINGKSLGTIKELAKRDSLVHKIYQVNQRVK